MSRNAWAEHVGGMTREYVAFLRGGVTCACGAHLAQLAPSAASGARSAAVAATKAVVEIDLTGDDDDVIAACVRVSVRARSVICGCLV